ncbi:hypothetical protein LCGC14_1347770 [marine sediment metagenome]|uniref:Uncharacterized protein n=1 Tax=marine sediment metagenome TaxID=412755 RepID=A0A0F9KCD8_9ZZZZ
MNIYMIRKLKTGGLQYLTSWPYLWCRQSDANMWWGDNGLKIARLILRDLPIRNDCEIIKFEFKERL